MADSASTAETVKVRFMGTTEGRNATSVIRLSGRSDIVLDTPDGGDEGDITLDELATLQQAGLILEVIEDDDSDAGVALEAEPAPVATRRSRQNPDPIPTEDSASS